MAVLESDIKALFKTITSETMKTVSAGQKTVISPTTVRNLAKEITEQAESGSIFKFEEALKRTETIIDKLGINLANKGSKMAPPGSMNIAKLGIALSVSNKILAGMATTPSLSADMTSTFVIIVVSKSVAVIVSLSPLIENKKSSSIGKTGLDPIAPPASCNCDNN